MLSTEVEKRNAAYARADSNARLRHCHLRNDDAGRAVAQGLMPVHFPTSLAAARGVRTRLPCKPAACPEIGHCLWLAKDKAAALVLGAIRVFRRGLVP